MSKFTRDVIRHSNAIRKAFMELRQKELEENDKYIQEIKKAAKPPTNPKQEGQ